MRLKLDENLDVRLAPWLRSLGHDAQNIREENLNGAQDERVFEVAAAEQRSLVTLDLDFSDPLHFPPADTAGTIVLRPPVPSMYRFPGGEDLDRRAGACSDLGVVGLIATPQVADEQQQSAADREPRRANREQRISGQRISDQRISDQRISE
jgi:uncharacterized protein DUF5615